jgi:RNA polymerase sigma-70 factor (ECF subfamily)
MSRTDESTLIDAAMRGDRSALGQLLGQYQHRLFNVVLRMVSNREDAADVTQEAMLKIVTHFDDFQGKAKLTTWMTRIAINQSISHLRKRRHRRTQSLDDDGGDNGWRSRGAQDTADDREPGPLERVQQKEMIAHLHRAMDGMDHDFRGVLVLRDIDQMNYQEIAQVLEVPVGTVKSRLFRARLALRQEMMRLVDKSTGRRATAGGGDG